MVSELQIFRVSSDMENLEMSWNFDARRKSQGKVGIYKNPVTVWPAAGQYF